MVRFRADAFIRADTMNRSDQAISEPIPAGDRLFVYGTLQPPSSIPLADRLAVIGPARVRGRLYDLGPYPGLIPADDADADWVHGLLCALPSEDPDLLADLDDYEGYDPTDPVGSLFVRERGTARVESGNDIPCWVYRYNRPVDAHARLVNGRWERR